MTYKYNHVVAALRQMYGKDIIDEVLELKDNIIKDNYSAQKAVRLTLLELIGNDITIDQAERRMAIILLLFSGMVAEKEKKQKPSWLHDRIEEALKVFKTNRQSL